jgi:hypothetical protein
MGESSPKVCLKTATKNVFPHPMNKFISEMVSSPCSDKIIKTAAGECPSHTMNKKNTWM